MVQTPQPDFAIPLRKCGSAASARARKYAMCPAPRLLRRYPPIAPAHTRGSSRACGSAARPPVAPRSVAGYDPPAVSMPANTSPPAVPHRATSSAASSVQPPAKTLRRRKRACSHLREQRIAPVDSRAQGLLPRRQIPRPAAARPAAAPDAPVAPPAPARDARRRQFDGQRQPVEPAAQLGHRRRVLGSRAKSGCTACARATNRRTAGLRPSPLPPSPRPHRGSCQRRTPGKRCSARSAQRHPAGDQHGERGQAAIRSATSGAAATTCSKLSSTKSIGVCPRCVTAARAAPWAPYLAQAQGLRDRRRDQRRVARRREVDEDYAIGVGVAQAPAPRRAAGASCPHRPAPLASDASAARAQQVGHRRLLVLAPDQGGRRDGEQGSGC